MSTFGYKKPTNHQFLTDLVVYLFDITRNNREEMDRLNIGNGINGVQYMDQFCTMVLSSVRGSGHTLSFLHLANIRHLKTLYIGHSMRHIKDVYATAYADSYGVKHLDFENIRMYQSLDVITLDRFIQAKGIMYRYGLVVVDCCFLHEPHNLRKIKEIMAVQHTKPYPFFLYLQPKL